MTTTTREIDDYVTAVHAALADLSDAEREDLLDDLPQNLADVQADRGGPLVELLGSPQDYAAELRATAGLDATPEQGPWWLAMRLRLASTDAWLGSLLNYDRFVDLLRALAPAWWLVRAYLLVQVGTHAVVRFGSHALVPQVDDSRAGGVVLLALACIGSVWLGRRGFTCQWQRIVSVALAVALLWYGVMLVRKIDETGTVVYVNNGDAGTSGITNIYPVGPDGSVLKNVRLYDQDGNPVQLGDEFCPTVTFEVQDPSDLASPGVSAAATTSPTYPLTCAANQRPFPSGQTAPLPAASSAAPAEPSSSAASAPAASPTASPSR